jgi:dolichol-phosphate mannosyltransferase
MRALSLVIPVFNNSPTLPELFERVSLLRNELNKIQIHLELIFVDDFSSDGSRQVLIDHSEKNSEVKLVLLSKNFGGINASKAGWSKVTGDVFTTLASDLQEPPELILQMAKEWLQGHQFVICERTSRNDGKKEKLTSSVFYRILRKFVFNDYPPGGFDLALLPKPYLPILLDSAKSVYPAALIWSLGLTPKVIYYHREARKHGKSGWTFLKKINAVINIIFGFTNKPMRFVVTLGGVTSGLSFSYGAVVVISSLINGSDIPGFATLATLLTFLFGIVIIILGIISEYLWLIFIEVNKQPTFVIEREYNTDRKWLD